jgi:site-specific DNA-methyltransferase (adenine-specific)
MSSIKLLLGDCLDKLKKLDDNSIDSIVTDPPYGLSFMGKKWDYDVPSQEIWEECIRVIKPGGYLLAFAGSRTYHRMAVRIEDAGFEIRDQIMWVYGSGFPKSMNIGKGVDKKLGNERELVERPKSEQRPNADNNRDKNKDVGGFAMSDNKYKSVGNSDWEGWGTALKPAHEPIVMARKPLSEKTVVDNVLKWGTGGINIDESRIGTQLIKTQGGEKFKGDGIYGKYNNCEESIHIGRFPANIIFDEEAGKILDEQSGITSQGHWPKGKTKGFGEFGGGESSYEGVGPKDKEKSGASRFFYCPKTSKKDRNEGLDEFEEKQQDLSRKEGNVGGDNKRNRGVNKRKNHHPTVKPTDLMLYLIRLVTPKGGATLDPFMGSGSTGKAAVRGGFDFIGIEREDEYMKIAEARIQYEIERTNKKNKYKQIDLF